MADKSMSARDLAAKLHSANARVNTAKAWITKDTSAHANLDDASALIKEVIGVLMEGETDFFGNYVPTRNICRCGHLEDDHVVDNPGPVVAFRPCFKCKCLGYEFEHSET